MLDNQTSQAIDVFTKEVERLGEGVYFITPYFREFKFFSYLGFGTENFFMYERALKNSEAMRVESKVDSSAITDLQFKSLGELEGTVTEDGQTVSWYEQGIYNTRGVISADTATNEIVVDDATKFAIDQLVSTQPVAGSTGTEVTAKVVTVDLGSNTVTLSAAVNAKEGDLLVIIQQIQEVGEATTGSYQGPKTGKLYSVFGKFGAELSFTLAEINTTRFFNSPTQYVKNKGELQVMKIYNEMANTFFKGTNETGNKPIAMGLEYVINERHVNNLASKFTLTGATEQEKLDALSDYLDKAAQSPIYNGQEPVLICNQAFASQFAKSMRKAEQVFYNDKTPAHTEYGLKTFSSPFFSDREMIVVTHMNTIYGNRPVAFIMPQHLVTFKQPLYSLAVTPDGLKQVPNTPGRISIVNHPTLTMDKLTSTMEYYVANIFAGMTYPDSYMRIIWE